MTKYHYRMKLLLAVAAGSLGLVTAALAQSPNVAVPNPGAAPQQGLLGSAYSGLAFNYAELDGGPPGVARGWNVYYNQPLRPGYDLTLDYNWMRARAFGLTATDQRLGAGLTRYFAMDWGRPYFNAGINWDWVNGNFGFDDNSFGLLAGGGVEFQVAPAFVIAPYANFARQTGYDQNEFDYGAKATYRFTREWSATLRAQYDAIRRSPDQTEYSLGVNYHF